MTGTNPSLFPACALVVDDVAFNRRVIGLALARDGMLVDEAGDVDAALDALAAQPYDVVLLDVALGEGGSGFDVLQAIRSRSEFDSLPVILVTGQACDPESVAAGLRAGAHDYITRPFEPSVLRARVAAARRARDALIRMRDRAEKAQTAASDTHDEIASAAAFQRASLPDSPLVQGGLIVSGEVVPSKGVSGDLYDVVGDPLGRQTVVLLDVAGHGAGAALVASAARQALRGALSAGCSFATTVAALEQCLATHGDVLGAAVALGLVRFSGDGRRVELLNAGLPPIARVAADGTVTIHASRSPPIGLLRGLPHPTDESTLGARDVFVLASDGMHAGSHDPDDALSLVARLRTLLNPAAIARAARSELHRWIREDTDAVFRAQPSDDATLVVATFDRTLGARGER